MCMCVYIYISVCARALHTHKYMNNIQYIIPYQPHAVNIMSMYSACTCNYMLNVACTYNPLRNPVRRWTSDLWAAPRRAIDAGCCASRSSKFCPWGSGRWNFKVWQWGIPFFAIEQLNRKNDAKWVQPHKYNCNIHIYIYIYIDIYIYIYIYIHCGRLALIEYDVSLHKHLEYCAKILGQLPSPSMVVTLCKKNMFGETT